jgi:hypothetical protein
LFRARPIGPDYAGLLAGQQFWLLHARSGSHLNFLLVKGLTRGKKNREYQKLLRYLKQIEATY